VPLNAARKKRVRLLGQATGLPYTAALRALDRRPELADQLLWPGRWPERFGRPVGIVAHPVRLGPTVAGASAADDRLVEIRLSYGPLHAPEARILTRRSLPDESATDSAAVSAAVAVSAAASAAVEDVPESRLRLELANFANRASEQAFSSRMRALESMAPEAIDVLLSGRPVPARRLRYEGVEAIGFQHETETVIYCGLEDLTDTVHFDIHWPHAQ
jgi:hypothetical protein